jgi:co-chaperonin GroES (HSP10)
VPFPKDWRWIPDGHIIIHENAQKLVEWAHRKIMEVVLAGPLCVEVKVGDWVLVDHFKGVEVEWKGEQLFVIKEDDVLATLEGATNDTRIW